MLQEPLTLYKLILLYLLKRAGLPLSKTRVRDFILEKGYTNYIILNQAIGELLDAGMITEQLINERSHFSLTEEGAQTLAFFQGNISDITKEEINTYLRENKLELISELSVTANYDRSSTGEFEAHLLAKEKGIPLVEITYSDKTDQGSVRLAKAFYQSIGKEAVVLNRECPGYIANRLQLAVYREMIDLVMRGVCTAEDADKALTYGPGIRWAIFGHNMIMQLGNPGGLKGMMAMLGAGGDVWLADMADWKHMPNEEYGEIAQASVDEMMKNFPDEVGHINPEIAKYRDRMLIEILKLHKKF